MTTNNLPSYIDLINSNDERFKLGLLWWYTLPDGISDYEFSFRFLRNNVPIDEIKSIIKDRLCIFLIYQAIEKNDKINELQKIIKRYHMTYRFDQDIISSMTDMLFDLVISDIYTSPKDSLLLFNCWNRTIRNFIDAGVARSNNTECMDYVTEFRKSRGFRDIKCGW